MKPFIKCSVYWGRKVFNYDYNYFAKNEAIYYVYCSVIF